MSTLSSPITIFRNSSLQAGIQFLAPSRAETRLCHSPTGIWLTNIAPNFASVPPQRSVPWTELLLVRYGAETMIQLAYYSHIRFGINCSLPTCTACTVTTIHLPPPPNHAQVLSRYTIPRKLHGTCSEQASVYVSVAGGAHEYVILCNHPYICMLGLYVIFHAPLGFLHTRTF